MTFGELCKQVSRECGEGISYEQTQRILATMWRIMLEELFIAPGESEIMLNGIGRFYIKKRPYHCALYDDNHKIMGYEYRDRFCYHFRPSEILKSVMAGKMSMKDLKIGSVPLYFEDPYTLKRPKSDFKEGKDKYIKGFTKKINYDRQEIHEAKNRKKRKSIEDRLPEE